MLFFLLLVSLTLLLALLARAGAPGLASRRDRMRLALAAALLLIGADHLLNPGRYLVMMPPFLPYPYPLVLFTGLCEIAGAVGLLIPTTRRLAGLMLAIYFVSVFPANIYVAFSGASIEGMPPSPIYYWIRLLFQPLAVWWALHVRAGGHEIGATYTTHA